MGLSRCWLRWMASFGQRLFRWCNDCHFLLMLFATIAQWMVGAIKQEMAEQPLRFCSGLNPDIGLTI